MVPVNISDNLKILGRSLHLETQFNPEDPDMIQTLYDQGKVLTKIRIHVRDKIADAGFPKWISEQHQEACDILRFLSETKEKILSHRHSRSLTALGKLFLFWGLTDEAIEVLNFAADPQSDSSQTANIQLIEAYQRRGEIQKASALIDPLLSKYPENDELWYERSKIRFQEKKYAEAFNDIKNAILKHPELDEYYLFAALASLNMAINKNLTSELPSQDSALRLCIKNLAQALKRTHRFSRIQLDPILKSLQKRNAMEAMIRLQGFIESLSREDCGLYELFYLFILYGDQGKKADMIKQYIGRTRMLTVRYPQNPRFHMNLGTGFIVHCREQFQKALHEFHTALSLDGHVMGHDLVKEAENLGNLFYDFMKRLLQ